MPPYPRECRPACVEERTDVVVVLRTSEPLLSGRTYKYFPAFYVFALHVFSAHARNLPRLRNSSSTLICSQNRLKGADKRKITVLTIPIVAHPHLQLTPNHTSNWCSPKTERECLLYATVHAKIVNSLRSGYGAIQNFLTRRQLYTLERRNSLPMAV